MALLASVAQGNFISDIAENVKLSGDDAIKKALSVIGKSESYIDCLFSMLKMTGAMDDLFNAQIILHPTKLVERLESKARFADFVCSNGGIPLLVGMAFLSVALICCGIFMARRHAQKIKETAASAYATVASRLGK